MFICNKKQVSESNQTKTQASYFFCFFEAGKNFLLANNPTPAIAAAVKAAMRILRVVKRDPLPDFDAREGDAVAELISWMCSRSIARRKPSTTSSGGLQLKFSLPPSDSAIYLAFEPLAKNVYAPDNGKRFEQWWCALILTFCENFARKFQFVRKDSWGHLRINLPNRLNARARPV